MNKNNSIIFVCFSFLLVMSGCGIKGPLYQTRPEKIEQDKPIKEPITTNSTSINENKQEK